MKIQKPLQICLACLFLFSLAGCGNGDQKYVGTTEAAVVTPADRLKGWLDSVAESGQLDSGVTMLPEMIEQFGASGASNVDELRSDADKLASLKSSSEIKALAKKMAQKIQ